MLETPVPSQLARRSKPYLPFGLGTGAGFGLCCVSLGGGGRFGPACFCAFPTFIWLSSHAFSLSAADPLALILVQAVVQPTSKQCHLSLKK